jgi:hypothetical protein
MEGNNEKGKDEIYSSRVKAGKRTYFFDIKSTKSDDFYLTITESKRKTQGEEFVFEKHKIFLYKEDFLKFTEALQEAIDYIKTELMDEDDLNSVEDL